MAHHLHQVGRVRWAVPTLPGYRAGRAQPLENQGAQFGRLDKMAQNVQYCGGAIPRPGEKGRPHRARHAERGQYQCRPQAENRKSGNFQMAGTASLP